MRWNAWLRALALICPASALAQAQPAPTDEGVVVEAPFVRGIEPNTWELGLQIGYLGLNHTLIESNEIVVDMEAPDELIFGSMELTGEFGFAPKFMLNRTFGSHLALENSVSFAFGDFEQSMTGAQAKWREVGSSNTLTENEIETGSFFALVQDHSLTYYPFGDGLLQPFVSGGIGSQWYELDSDYIADGLTGAFSFSYGLGLRVVADDLYSFRLEVRNYHAQVEFEVADYWRVQQNEAGNALISVPVMRLVDFEDATVQEIEEIFQALDLPLPAPLDATTLPAVPVRVESFDPIDFTNLYFSLGFTAAF
jgi:hypothetical protein